MNPEKRKLFYLLGFQRSGTTLLCHLIDKHPEALCAEEPEISKRIVFQQWDLLKDPSYDSIKQNLDFYGVSGASYTELTGQYLKGEIPEGKFFERFLELLSAKKRKVIGAKEVIDLSSSKYCHIKKLLKFHENQNVKFIFIERDIKAVVASFIKLGFYPPGKRKLSNSNMKLFAKNYIKTLNSAEESLLNSGKQCLFITYEELIASPCETMKKIYSFIGVDSSEQLVNELLNSPSKGIRSVYRGQMTLPSSWTELISPREALMLNHLYLSIRKSHFQQKNDIRTIPWHLEAGQFWEIDKDTLEAATSEFRFAEGSEPESFIKARKKIETRFMQEDSSELYRKVKTSTPDLVSDVERSSSWRDYIFLCINSERKAFGKIPFFDRIIESIVLPLLDCKGQINVLDFGCGPSMFTRMLSQDFGEKVKTISADVCKYAVEFSKSRNQWHNSNASGHLIEEVMDVPAFENINLLLALTVFEHLPNSTEQIKGLINSLAEDGILIENYSGHSSSEPHKSDTFDAYKNRDKNLDLLSENLELLYGKLPPKVNGCYERDQDNRIWITPGCNPELKSRIKRNLIISNATLTKLFRKIGKIFK